VQTYDPVLDEFLIGNAALRMTEVHNFDVRWEWYPRPGEILSVSLFYKDIKDAIERRFIDRTGNIVTFTNSPKAFVYGLELEGRTTLDWLDPSLRHFSLGGNVSLIKSETDVLPDVQDSLEEFGVRRTKRPLTDQSPYIVNLDLSYDNPHSGTSVSLIYNVFGPRLIISSMNSPDIYEQPAAGLDFVFSQKLGRHTKLKFTAKNLLDPAIEKTYGEEAEQVYSSYTKGMSFGLSFTYDF
jgi:outer membrane receptor protein involved in Fe transport